MSVAFTKEDSAETAAETMLPEKPIPPGPNLVTAVGLAQLERQLAEATAAYETALAIEDINERRRQAANPYRDLRYLNERLRTAQVVPPPESNDLVAFGSRITIERDDGRTQTFTIVGEDQADPKAGTLSFASPLARALMGKGVGDVATLGEAEVEIVGIGLGNTRRSHTNSLVGSDSAKQTKSSKHRFRENREGSPQNSNVRRTNRRELGDN